MRTLFFGSGDFSRQVLERLLDGGITPLAVVTSPDRPKGRGLKPGSTPVKELARGRNIDVIQPPDLGDPRFTDTLYGLRPHLIISSDYGKIIPGDVLDVPERGSLNLHPSLLPRYRGADPIRRAILEGEVRTGVTLMLMDEGMDTGPIVAQSDTEIGPEEDADSLRARLAELGAKLMREELPSYLSGLLEPIPQDEEKATYAPPIRKPEAVIEWSRDAEAIHRQVRALSTSPGAYTFFRGKRLKILRARVLEEDVDDGLGVICRISKKRMAVGTGKGCLEPLQLQPEGKRRMEAGEFMLGYRLSTGEGFTSPEA